VTDDYTDRDMGADDLGGERHGAQQTGASSEGAAPGQTRTRTDELMAGLRRIGELHEGRDWLADSEWPDKPWLLKTKLRQSENNIVEPEGFLPAGVAGLLVSPGGFGKTHMLTQLALAVATGTDWLNTFTVERPGKVLLMLGEEPQDEMDRRVWRASRQLGLPRADRLRQDAYANLYTLPAYGQDVAFLMPDGRSSTDVHGALMEYLEAHGPWSLIVLDPASRFHGLENENDNAGATQFVRLLEALTKAPGRPTVVAAHHTNKNSISADTTDQSAARGASSFVDSSRWVANLEREPLVSTRNIIRLRLVKSNYGPRVPVVTAEMTANGPRALSAAEIAEIEMEVAVAKELAKLEKDEIREEAKQIAKGQRPGGKVSKQADADDGIER